MRVLVACECSGRVRNAFAALGHDAWSCDLKPSETHGQHLQCDVLSVLKDGWDIMIAHPFCKYLANSGVHWLHKQPERWELMRQGAEFFKKLLNAPIQKIAVENPIQHKYAREIIGAKQSQVIQPWMFGHPEQKATCLWLKNLPLLKPTNDVKEAMMRLPDNQRQRLHYLPPSPQREAERSRTFQGIADAMADQWTGEPQFSESRFYNQTAHIK